MNISRCLCLVNRLKQRNLPLYKENFIILHKYSTEAVTRETIFDDEMTHAPPRQLSKKPSIEPFLKQVFMAKVNRDILAYPEIMKKDDMDALDTRVEAINKIFNEKMSSTEAAKAFRNLRLAGAPASYFHGGLEANCTERLRLLEAAARTGGAARWLRDRWMGIQCLQDGLTEDLLDKYLPNIANGSEEISVCLRERVTTDPSESDMQCLATRDIHGQWTVSGEKITSLTAGPAHLVAVCRVERQPVQAFFIPKGERSVRFKDGFVTFENTPAIPLGNQDEEKTMDSHAAVLMKNVLATSRLDTAAIAIGLLKEAITVAIRATSGKYISGRSYSSLETLQDRFARAVTSLYGAEACAYFSAGLVDDYKDYDADAEAVATRVYATREATLSSLELLEICYSYADHADLKAVEKCYEECRKLQMEEEQNDSLRIYLAMTGLQFAGLSIADIVKKMRNPLFHPGFMFGLMMKQRRQIQDDPKLDLHLGEHLHPSLDGSALDLEYCIMRMQFATENLLRRHGRDVLDQHREIARLGEIAIEVFTMIASISRASRSYCIGIANSDREMEQAILICHVGKNRVRELVRLVVEGNFISGDTVREVLAKETVRLRLPPAEHALTRVFW